MLVTSIAYTNSSYQATVVLTEKEIMSIAYNLHVPTGRTGPMSTEAHIKCGMDELLTDLVRERNRE